MLYDRLAGKPTEHEQILGAVVRTADAVGVPVPSTKALLALLRALPTSWSGTGELTARG
jgi:2-dehydropantoate 2-reductase